MALWRIHSARALQADSLTVIAGGLVAIPVPDNVADQSNDIPKLPSIAQLSQLSVMDCMMGKYRHESSVAH